MSDTVYLNNKPLKDLIRAFKKIPKIKVGVRADDERKECDLSNADIGKKHEFGKDGMPQRSFLRMPLNLYLNSYIEKAHYFDKGILAKVIEEKSIMKWAEGIGAIAEKVVLEAFDTGGFGQWPKWKDPNYTNNANMILVDTRQLRNSITHEVKEGK